MDEKGEKDPLPLQIDPKCIQDALRAFLPPIKNDDARLDFYTMYKKEATEYDTDYVKKYDEDLNTTLIFAGLFSAVSSAFVIDVHSKLQPDPNDQSAALLRAILLTLNQSAIPNENPTIPSAQEDPPSEIVTVTGLMYASLLMSLLAAFIAMLGKQWLNRYLRNAGGSTIERCGDRQRKCDGLQKWPFHLFVESLPLMLQAALLLLASGLCRHMWSINTSVASVLITLTVLGVLFYLGIVIVGASSYECPFQTPVSTALRSTWKKTGPHITATFLHVVAAGTSLYKCLPWPLVLTTLHHLWEAIQCQILHVVFWSPPITTWYSSQNPPLPTTQPTPQQPMPWLASLYHLWENIQCKILCAALHLPSTLPLSTIPEGLPIATTNSPWLKPTALATLQSTNANDVRCVSWILWSITDPEALDAAIRLAGTIRWFEGGLNVEPPYDQIISTLKGCFDSAGKIYPGSRDRAYHSAQAVLWIHICAMCVSEDFADRFPLPTILHDNTSLDLDLSALLDIYNHQGISIIFWIYLITSDTTPGHIQWTSNTLLHLSWAKRTTSNISSIFSQFFWGRDWGAVPLNAVLNRLLASCIFLGQPVEEEVLKIQAKSGYFDQILSQFSQAMVAAIHSSHPHCKLLKDLLSDLASSETRTTHLTEMAYEWCSVVCKNYSSLEDGKDLLLLSLEIGFHHLDPEYQWINAELVHTEHHQGLANIVFESKSGEAIADLLCAWTSRGDSHKPYTSLNICAKHLISLHYLYPFPPRLRDLIMRTIPLIGYQEFQQVGVEGFIGLLNDLQVNIEDVLSGRYNWASLLLATIQTSEGVQHLSHPYWDLLVEFTILRPWWLGDITYSPHTMASLKKAGEWDKLECWMSFVWMLYPPEGCKTTEEDLRDITLLLFYKKPDAIHKLMQWMEQWAHRWGQIPGSFQQIYEQVHNEEAQQAGLSTISTNGGTIESTNLQLHTLQLYLGDDTF